MFGTAPFSLTAAASNPAAGLLALVQSLSETVPGILTQATRPAGSNPGAGGVLAPIVILLMCLVAGVATAMLLPSRREGPFRKMGGAILLAAGLIVAALLVREAARRGGGMGVYFWAFSAVALIGAVRVVTHPRPVYSALYFVLTVFATAGLFILMWAEFMAAALVLIYAGAILVTYVFVIMLAASTGDPAAATGAPADLDPDGPSRADVVGDGADNGNRAGNGTYGDTAYAHGGGASAVTTLAEHDAVSRDPLVAAAVGFALMGIMLFVIFDRAEGLYPPADRQSVAGPVLEAPAVEGTEGATQRLGVYLFRNHAVNLELAGLLLTVSMVGAIIIARRRVVTAEGADAAEAAPVGGRFGAPGRPAPAAGAMSAIDDDPHAIPVYGTDNPRQKAYPET